MRSPLFRLLTIAIFVAAPQAFAAAVTGSAAINKRVESVQHVLRFYMQGDGGFTKPTDLPRLSRELKSPDDLAAAASALEGQIETQLKVLAPEMAQINDLRTRRDALLEKIAQAQAALGPDKYSGLAYWFVSKSEYDQYEKARAEQMAKIATLQSATAELEGQLEVIGFKFNTDQSDLMNLKTARENVAAFLQGWVKRGTTPTASLAAFSCSNGLTAYEYAPTSASATAREPFGDSEVSTDGLPAILACADDQGTIAGLTLVDRSKLAGAAAVFKVEIARDGDGRLERVRVTDARDQQLEASTWTKDGGFHTEFVDEKGVTQTLSIPAKP